MQWLDELDQLKGRGEIKRWGKRIDQDLRLRHQIIDALLARGDSVDSKAAGKKLLRQWLDRSAESQIRRNPIHLNETFVCEWCGWLNPLSLRIRDHCAVCLRSKHLDIVPGDRAANCQSIMHPTSLWLEHGEIRIEYLCSGCSHQHQIWSHPEDQVPHSLSVLDLPSQNSMRRKDEES